MTEFKVLVTDVNSKPLSGKTVTATKQGFDKSAYHSITDINGIAEFSISAWNETVQIEAEGFSSGTTTINVDWLGKAVPDFVTIQTSFNPADQLGHTVKSLGDYFKGLGTLGIVVIALIVAVILFIVIRKLLSGETKLPSLPKLPKIPFPK